ncbi:MAG: hypothetical protein A2219_00210 [Elusimicrobia bacterium RIFOXYA2_FULL_50_26]|nr:MAG: hypothetical protein A2219_00210 [Elusimicrobia bacterium RIFOXYA2_FULL_50_26]
MKKIAMAVLAVMLGSSASFAVEVDLTGSLGYGYLLNSIAMINGSATKGKIEILVQALTTNPDDENLKYGIESGYMPLYSLSDVLGSDLTAKYTVTSIPLMGLVKYGLGDTTAIKTGEYYPYVIGGLGFHFVTSALSMTMPGLTLESSETKTYFGSTLGGGIRYRASEKVDLDLSIRYNTINADDTVNVFNILMGVGFRPSF